MINDRGFDSRQLHGGMKFGCPKTRSSSPFEGGDE